MNIIKYLKSLFVQPAPVSAATVPAPVAVTTPAKVVKERRKYRYTRDGLKSAQEAQRRRWERYRASKMQVSSLLPVECKNKNNKYPFDRLAVGEGFFVDGAKYRSVWALAKTHTSKTGNAYAFKKTSSGGLIVKRTA